MYHTQFTYLDHTTVLEATFESDLEIDAPLLEQLGQTARVATGNGFALLLVADNYCIAPSLIALASRFRLHGLTALAICCPDATLNNIHRKHLHDWFPSLVVGCFPDRKDAMNWLNSIDRQPPDEVLKP